MAKKLSSVLGIDIGSRSVKVAEIRAQGSKGAAVTAVGMAPTPEGAVDYNGVYNPDAVAAALKEAMKNAGAGAPYAVVSISGQQAVLVRTLEVPRMTDDELKGHMEWEIGRSVAFAESTIESDFRKLPEEDPNSVNMDVVMAASPRSAIDTVVECVKKAGKRLAAIDVEPLAIGRSLAMSYEEEMAQGSVCVVDMGHSTTAIDIYKNGTLMSPRQVPIGGEMLTTAISEALGIGLPEAEEMKIAQAYIPEEAVALDPNAGFQSGFGTFDPNPFDPNATQMGGGTYDAGASPASGYSGVGGYDPNATTSAPGVDYAVTGETTGTAVSPYGNSPFGADDEISINPITGEPMTPPVAPVVTNIEPTFGVGDGTPVYEAGDTGADDAGAIPGMDATSGFEPGAEPAFIPLADLAPVPVAQADPSYEAMRPVLEEFVAEIRRSIEYYSGRGGAVSAIYLAGGGARVRGLGGYVGRSLNVDCHPYDPLKGLQVSARRVAPGFLEDHRQELAIAVGNGLHILFG